MCEALTHFARGGFSARMGVHKNSDWIHKNEHLGKTYTIKMTASGKPALHQKKTEFRLIFPV